MESKYETFPRVDRFAHCHLVVARLRTYAGIESRQVSYFERILSGRPRRRQLNLAWIDNFAVRLLIVFKDMFPTVKLSFWQTIPLRDFSESCFIFASHCCMWVRAEFDIPLPASLNAVEGSATVEFDWSGNSGYSSFFSSGFSATGSGSSKTRFFARAYLGDDHIELVSGVLLGWIEPLKSNRQRKKLRIPWRWGRVCWWQEADLQNRSWIKKVECWGRKIFDFF